jgi:UDP-N-acetylglucosamine kinase
MADIEQWIRDNKKRIAKEFVRRSEHSRSEHPVGIVTAGLPGAGKTEFTQELLKQTSGNPLRIDMDEIATLIEGYKPKIADKFRIGASAIMSRIYDEVTKEQIDFVLDGTFAGTQAVHNIERAVKHGYTIKLYYIYQQPAIAWKFTQAREKVEHRSISKAGFIDTYFRVHENLGELEKHLNNITVSIILKDEDNKVGRVIEDVPNILQSIPALMTRIELEKTLQ